MGIVDVTCLGFTKVKDTECALLNKYPYHSIMTKEN